jgi:hypothetical protein
MYSCSNVLIDKQIVENMKIYKQQQKKTTDKWLKK